MKSIAPYFQLYTDYMAKFENAIKTLNEMSAKNEIFSQIVKDLEVGMCTIWIKDFNFVGYVSFWVCIPSIIVNVTHVRLQI